MDIVGDPPMPPSPLFFECGDHLCVKPEGYAYLFKLKQYSDELYTCLLNSLGE